MAGSLTHADISDIIAGRPEKEVLGALRIISQALAEAKLKTLDLSDNALGQKGIIACTQAFAQQVIAAISFLDPLCSDIGTVYTLNDLFAIYVPTRTMLFRMQTHLCMGFLPLHVAHEPPC